MQLADAFFSLHDRLLIAVFGLLLHLLIFRAHIMLKLRPVTPYAWGAAILRWFESRLNRSHRAHSALQFRGLLSALIVFVWCVALGFALGILVQQVKHGELFDMLLIALALGARPALDICWIVFGHIKGKVQMSQSLADRIGHQAADARDEHSMARAAIEAMFTRYATELIGPLFWYILCGMPGLVACATFTQAERFMRTRGMRGALFGHAVRILYQIIHFVPARIAATLVVLASVFIPSCHPIRALFMMFAESGKLRSTPFGWSLGALAGALSLALGGPRSHYLLLGTTPWIGGGSVRPSARDMARAMFLYGIALQLVLLIIALVLYAPKFLNG